MDGRQSLDLPWHELAALGTATCWALTGLFAADAVRHLGAFHFNLFRQLFVTVLLVPVVVLGGHGVGFSSTEALVLALSGVIGILLGDTVNFAAVARLGPRRAGAVFALNAPLAAVLAWAILDEALTWKGWLGILMAACGVALAVIGRPRADTHRFEGLQGVLWVGILCGLAAALGQAAGSLIARPIMLSGIDPWAASLVRVGASGLAMGVIAATPFAPALPRQTPPLIWGLTAATAVIGLLLGMTLFLYALQGSQTGIIATLSATSPVIILPLLWLRTGQRPTATSWAGALMVVAGLALIFTR